MDSERWDVSLKPRQSRKKRLWQSVPRKRKNVNKTYLRAVQTKRQLNRLKNSSEEGESSKLPEINEAWVPGTSQCDNIVTCKNDPELEEADNESSEGVPVFPKPIQSAEYVLPKIKGATKKNKNATLLAPSTSNTQVTIHVGQRTKSFSHFYKKLKDSHQDGDTVQNTVNEFTEVPIEPPEGQDLLLKKLNALALKVTLARIQGNPQLYIGIPENCDSILLRLLYKHTRISLWHLVLCLKKIKHDTHFDELADQFGMTSEEAKGLFLKNIPFIAKNLESFIMIKSKTMQINLPIPFRRRNTTIIDSLELKVQPSTTYSRDLTQSDKGNTVKYMISCCPSGFINYVSPGYGGRLSDENLLESTGYLEQFEPGSCIITNAFKNAEPMLSRKGLKLLRPHQDFSSGPVRDVPHLISNSFVRSVVGRVREFAMVNERTVISSDLVKVLDEVVIISCALINLQSL